MNVQRFFAILAVTLGVATSASADGFDGGKTVICHRTGANQKGLASGLFPGNILSVGNKAVAQHVGNHRDVVLGAAAQRLLKGSRSCAVNSKGAVFDDKNNLVQPAPGGNGGGGTGGGGHGGGNGGGDPPPPPS